MELNQIISYVATGIFYLATGILGFLGAFCIYIYIRYGRSPIIAVIVSILFAFMFLTISGNALRLLQNI
jgi:putative flippase GtrA